MAPCAAAIVVGGIAFRCTCGQHAGAHYSTGESDGRAYILSWIDTLLSVELGSATTSRQTHRTNKTPISPSAARPLR